jgi:hypothetical protein
VSRVLAAGVAVAATAGLVAASGVRWVANEDPGARLRLSWRAAGQRVEACRAPTEDELAGLPPHMRPREICEGRLLPFRLVVAVDGETVLERTVHPAGARADRPTYVFEEIPLEPGAHRLRVDFTVERPADAPVSEAGDRHLATEIEAAPGRVVLVTDRDGLAVVGAPD